MNIRPTRHLIEFGLTACFLAPLMVLAFIGQFSRYLADDYCTASRALADGVVGSMLWWYNNWAGQFTNWTVKGIAGVIGPTFATVFPALILILWIVVLTWTLHHIFSFVHLPLPLSVVLLLSAIILFAIFDGTPSVIQSLYWIGASIPYTTPLIPLTFFIGLFFRTLRYHGDGRVPIYVLVVAAATTFIAAGLSEVYAAFQTTVIGLILLAVFFRAPAELKRTALSFLIVGLGSSLLTMAIIISAPGNAVRQAAFPPPSSLPMLTLHTITVSASYIVLAIGVFSPLALLSAVVIPAYVMFGINPSLVRFRLSARRVRVLLVLSALVALILVMASLAPALYALSTAPAGRVYIMPQLALVVTAVFWGCVIGLSARQNNLYLKPSMSVVGAAVLAVLLIANPIASTLQALRDGSQFSIYAAEWDSRDREIRAAAANGVQAVEVAAFTADMGTIGRLETIDADTTNWVNQCAAMYYGVSTLSARTPFQMGDKPTESS